MATASPAEPTPPSENAGLRSDAVMSRRRILQAAATTAPDATMGQIATAAGVGRSTLYRHFPTRLALETALDRREEAGTGAMDRPGERVVGLPFTTPGRLGRTAPLALEVTRVLDEVPPHLVPDQLVAEARRAAGVPVALYVVDIDGSRLLRLAGSEDFPAELDAPPAVGPEIVPAGLAEFHEHLQRRLPGCVCEPLWLRGRVTGVLLCVGAPRESLADIATQGAAALELAADYTDAIAVARRRKPTTPAAEIQQSLFPPRIVRMTGAELAGVLLPAYEVGGDWFDFVENRDGAWIAIADASGTGPTAAGLGAAALGALRAARRSGRDLSAAAQLMDETVRALKPEDFTVTVWLARWNAATVTVSCLNCGHPSAYVVDIAGEMSPLEVPELPPLGSGKEWVEPTPTRYELSPGQRLILVTRGIVERRLEDGSTFGADGIRRALGRARDRTAAATAMAIQQGVTDCWAEPLEDDGTIVVLAVE